MASSRYSMRVLQAVMLVDVLVEWGFHECRGRTRDQLAPHILQSLDGPEGPRIALEVILTSRAPVIANILAAFPMQCMRVEVRRADLAYVRVMGPPPLMLQEHASRAMTQEDSLGIWVRSRVSGEDVEGPCVAVARNTEGPITLVDGLHRAAAWVVHGNTGRDYPLTVNVIMTQQPTWYEGQS